MTYEYICISCEKKWEQEQSIKDDPIKQCPFCQEIAAKRLISQSSFILLGGGWYRDGYK